MSHTPTYRRPSGLTLSLLACLPLLAEAPPKSIHPAVKRAVAEISEERIAASLKKLESFGTRYVASSTDDPAHGRGATHRWIFEQFQSYSPRLQVRYDKWLVPKMARVNADVEVVNVVAVLPGKVFPETQVILSCHHDTVAYERGQGSGRKVSERAPGVVDNGSGVAAVLELARVLSQYEFDKTLVFVAFDAEEEGLFGASLHAQKAKASNQPIEAVLNNDIIGGDFSANGFRSTHAIRVFSGGPMDSGSRSLARYIKEVGERYVPEMRVDLIYRSDRFGRGGDHTPFHQRGFSAVRFTTPAEHYQNQHSAGDTFENASAPYTARVTRVNAAVAASLALAPKPPVLGTLGRGPSQYDAVTRWQADDRAAGYEVVIRSTLAPFWEREITVEKVGEYTLKNYSIDDVVIGVRAFNKDGIESLVSAYAVTERPARDVEATERR